jgi:uncharacterized protein (TIGR03435 family)
MLKTSAALISVFLLATFGAIRGEQNGNQQASRQQQAAQQESASQQSAQQKAGDASANSSAAPRLEFEVASIKPGNPNSDDNFIKAMPGGQTYQAVSVSVRLMIRLMWKLNDARLVEAPDWVNKDLWDVQAKADKPRSLDDLHTMYQNMIIDRFKMKFHWDTRDMSMYALVQDKSGEKMKLNTDPEPFDFPLRMTAFGRLEAKHCDMRYFTYSISGMPWIGRPVVDRTGLDKSAFYDFTLLFAPEVPAEVAARGNLPSAPGPDFFTAIREQLGLRLEAKKGPVPVMVIDSIQKPSEADN